MPVGEEGGTPFGPLLHLAREADPEDQLYSVARACERLKEWGGSAVAYLLPIASNAANGYFCLDYRNGGEAPKVVFVEMTYAPGDSSAILPVADSFSQALARLYRA